jgi:uncharacterized protein YxjI
MKEKIKIAHTLHVQQVYENWELLGFETRNKYKILDEKQNPVGFAAEQASGISGAILRQFLGHWRSFKVLVYDQNKTPIYTLDFPFRWFFKTLYVSDANGRKIGHLEQRFAIFRKKFDLHNVNNRVIAKINSSFFKFWTFEFFDNHRSLGKIQKKWAGALSEIFTDKDNFVVTFDHTQDEDMKIMMLSTCIMVDIIYFENNKAGPLDLLD